MEDLEVAAQADVPAAGQTAAAVVAAAAAAWLARSGR